MRLVGIETEYGLVVEGRSPHTQFADSAALVAHCQENAFEGWDYAFESPRADLRGFVAEKLSVDPVDAAFDEAGARDADRADRVLTNGARFYNDHGHPEYATPECARILDLVAHDRAGEIVVLRAARALEKSSGRKVTVYKNNTDFHGASYGTHENYLIPRRVGFEALAKGILPLLIVRQILFGAGKVGSEVGRSPRFQLSQRADFLSEVAGVDTLYRRPIFNTRDEPHADPEKWTRLHVICGDANRIEWATGMKAGVFDLALRLVEMGEAPSWMICNPVKAFENISKDERFEWKLELENGHWTTGIEILDSYLSAAEHFLRGSDAATDWVLAQWRLAVEDLRIDPMRLANRSDWAAKLAMLEKFAEDAGRWDSGTMQSLDLEYHNIDPEESLFAALDEGGEVVSLVDPARIEDSTIAPPADTRAKQRGDLVSSERDKIVTIGWRRALLREGDRVKVVEFQPA
jgi:proteasome accessory factor A